MSKDKTEAGKSKSSKSGKSVKDMQAAIYLAEFLDRENSSIDKLTAKKGANKKRQ